jgi:hypothetical protein
MTGKLNPLAGWSVPVRIKVNYKYYIIIFEER